MQVQSVDMTSQYGWCGHVKPLFHYGDDDVFGCWHFFTVGGCDQRGLTCDDMSKIGWDSASGRHCYQPGDW